MLLVLKKNDIIISIDDQKVKSILEVSKYIMMSTGMNILILIFHDLIKKCYLKLNLKW